jgi:hypothetical protein
MMRVHVMERKMIEIETGFIGRRQAFMACLVFFGFGDEPLIDQRLFSSKVKY